MPEKPVLNLLEALLDSWDRNNQIQLNLLRLLPEGGLAAKAAPTSPTVGQMLAHMVYIRMVHVFEDAPEHAGPVPDEEWPDLRDREGLARMLEDSARTVRAAAADRIAAGRDMDLHYDHPLLLIQNLLWHEGYHHGQIKLALKVEGFPLDDEEIGLASWGVWMDKTATPG